MASPNVKRVPIMLDRLRYIVLDLNAYCLAEELTGKNFLRSQSWEEMSFTDMRALLLAGLRKDEPGLTLEQLGEWVHSGNLEAISTTLLAAFTNSMPEAAPDANGPLGVRAVPRHSPEAIDMELIAPTS